MSRSPGEYLPQEPGSTLPPRAKPPDECKHGHDLRSMSNVYWSRGKGPGGKTVRRWYCKPCAADRKRAQLARQRS